MRSQRVKSEASARRSVAELTDIPNIGPSIADDLRRIGVRSPADLRGKDPLRLYKRLCAHDGVRHDPCVLDVFMAAVDYMGGAPARPWWKYTARRKKLGLGLGA